MARCKTFFRMLGQVIILGMALLIITMPVMRAAHSHAYTHGLSQYDDYTDHSDKQEPHDNGNQCPQCEFYSHFVPTDAGAVPTFVFVIPVRPVPLQFGGPRDGTPCKGKFHHSTNKDPPSVYIQQPALG